MISVTMQFPNEEAVIAFFAKHQQTIVASVPPLLTAAQEKAIKDAEVNAADDAARQALQDQRKSRGRPAKKTAEGKTETPPPEVGQNTGSGSPELNPPADTCPPAGAPQGDAAAGTALGSAKAESGAATANPATLDDTRISMLAVTEKLGQDVGMEKLNEILVEKAGVKLLRDLPADKYQVVIDACAKAVA